MTRILALVLFATPAAAMTDIERLSLAQSLGLIIAMEQPCGLSYDPDALDAYVSETAGGDLLFAGQLSGHIAMAELLVEDQTESARVAQCANVRGIALSAGLIG